MHGGVVRNPIQPEELIKSESEENLEQRPLGAPIGFAGDEPVESTLPADNAKGQLLHQAAIRRRKSSFTELQLQQIFEPSRSIRVPLQQTRGNFSWFLQRHVLIMPIAQLQSRI